MNRRINKTIAEKAAITMAAAAFNCQIELARKQVSVAVDLLVRKYIPKIVRSVCADFPSYFEKDKHAYISTPRTFADGYVGHEDYICGELSFYIPHGSRYINVSTEEYKDLKKLHRRVKALENEQENFKQQIFDALSALRTENKVKESLPEALPFIEFPDEVHLPAPVFGTLRNIIKNIKTDAKQE
jgi:hypothetical protein